MTLLLTRPANPMRGAANLKALPLPPAPLSSGNCSTVELENKWLLIGCPLEGIIFHLKTTIFEDLEAPFCQPANTFWWSRDHGDTSWDTFGPRPGFSMVLGKFLGGLWDSLWRQFGHNFMMLDVKIDRGLGSCFLRGCGRKCDLVWEAGCVEKVVNTMVVMTLAAFRKLWF